MTSYLDKYRGFLAGVLQWRDLTVLWQTINDQKDVRWYIYAVGDSVPVEPATPDQLTIFTASINKLLHQEHNEDYCGIVYVDDVENPSMVKIYDPNNLGVVCGYSDNPPLPGWVMSHIPPEDLEIAFPPPANRKRWWQKIFNG